MMTSGPSFAPGKLSLDQSSGSARRAWRGRSPERPPAAPQVGLRPPLLLVIGSHHPVTLAQIDQLAAHAPDAMATIQPETTDFAAAVEALAAALAARGRAALVFALPDGTGAEPPGRCSIAPWLWRSSGWRPPAAWP